jgi:purine nucleosidase
MEEASSVSRWPMGTDEKRVQLLSSPRTGIRRMVLDTDADNETDDQFAIAHALLASDLVEVEAIYAAPFHNSRSASPGDGMQRSLQEIRRVLELVNSTKVPAIEGASDWFSSGEGPKPSAAAEDLIRRALGPDQRPLYVVAIGAPTNVATALALAPEITDRIVVIWLGGNSLYWPTTREFNLRQDLQASRLIFDSGVALVHVPCLNVADHMITTREEIDHHVRPAGTIGGYLARRYAERYSEGIAVSGVLWDVAAVGWLLDSSWTTSSLVQSPILTNEMTWSRDPSRHLIAEVTAVRRDAILADLFTRLADCARRV